MSINPYNIPDTSVLVIEENDEPTIVITPRGIAGPRGPIGPQGPPNPGTAGDYVHTQVNPTLLVLVQHNLNYRPAGVRPFSTQVNEIPTDEDEVDGLVSYLNENLLTVRFTEPFAGIIYVS